MYIIKTCTCFVLVFAVFAGCIGTADDSLSMGAYVKEGIEHIAPVYADLHNDFITKNYESMAEHAQQLQRVVETELAGIGYDDRSANTFATGLSRKDTLLHSKYEGYLKKLQSMAISVQIPVSWIKNDPSKLSQNELLNAFKDAFSLSKEGRFQFEALLKSCAEYKTDCGQKLSDAKDLRKDIAFL